MENDKLAQEIIQEWNQEDSDAGTTMTLYQQVANHFYPHQSQITQKTGYGLDDKSLEIIDPAGVRAADKMASGMYSVVIPSGQYFCRLVAEEDELNDDEEVRSYLARATQILHKQIFKSNFEAQFSMYLRSLITFGTANIFSTLDPLTMSLRFRNWQVSNFRFRCDAYDRPNQCLIKWNYTAQQAYELFGDNAGKSILEAIQKIKEGKPCSEKFPFIFRVRPRKNRDMSKTDRLNYPFEERIVSEKDKQVVYEGGYKQFPHHITRWLMGDEGERWGYGQGCVALSLDKELQHQRKSLSLCADLHTNPPRQTLASAVDHPPKVYPGANNMVMEMDAIRALDRNLQGEFPYNEKMLMLSKEDMNECFFIKVFQPLEGLTGDRRNMLEISERVKSGFMQMIQPAKLLYGEGVIPLVERCTLLLLEYRILPPTPPQLRAFKVIPLGRLALALEEQQSDALTRFSQFSLQMEAVIPHFTEDNINVDRAGRRMATTFGVNEGDLNSDEERAAIRKKRAQEEQQMKMMMAMQAAASAAKDGSTAPEAGSPTEQMMAGVGG